MAGLAVWRVTHLLAREDGPGGVIARLRAQAGSGQLGELMDCFDCLSIWVAAPFAFSVARRPGDRLVSWLALSGAACVLQRLTGHEDIVDISAESGGQHELLQPEAGGRGRGREPAPPSAEPAG